MAEMIDLLDPPPALAPPSTRGEPRRRPTALQRAWLVLGLAQPGGKLPLFDPEGQPISPRTVRSCIDQGWAEPWFSNPLKPDWLVCKLSAAGRSLFGASSMLQR